MRKKGKKKEQAETNEVETMTAEQRLVMLETQVVKLQGDLRAANGRVVERERTHTEINALLQVVVCFIISKFKNVGQFEKVSSLRNIWMWVSILPFLVDVTVELICIMKKGDNNCDKNRDKRMDRLNTACR